MRTRSASTIRVVSDGFTLIELLVATAVFLLLVLLTLTITDKVGGVWRGTSDAIGEWQATRRGFEAMTRRISQATLDTTWAYFDSNGKLTTSDPVKYGRHSQLQFVCGAGSSLLSGEANVVTQAVFFQAPLGSTRYSSLRGLPHLLNACGFYVQFNNDADFRPSAAVFQNADDKWRFRLMELVDPSENLNVYGSSGATDFQWFLGPIDLGLARPLADNVIALIILPRYSKIDALDGGFLAPDYSYNSRVSKSFNSGDVTGNTLHQLPPLLQITMVALSNKSAIRLAQEFGDQIPADIFDGASFTKPADYSKDLATLEDNLIGRSLRYRVFSSVITVRGAKWSGDTP